ncbi:MAG: ubiquinol-cytochrome c reductase [Porticoccaceae bacterium]|jgi:ubiquinol-cytochrome c reductase cytochrome b subunit|nr:ubiquinol-cytochrome c reductase [Porticoccaceae bacterium]MBT3797806.1 ubiquinol-cytochrome c reductase [Porticoccaceae bacterium]MBT4163181.1 ubiquinol-cytochrome c reductase [Porticoccaceae bacterium]MBT4210997.1 ubiquinol-cytochrome c reductase [Porticoccaceae bacterium]MBT6422895.1 ubiquinol-cytochrome c reductase [Porticoccaceae bacterium]
MSEEKGFAAWLDSRMPTLKREWNRHMAEYYAPKNFNFWYYFGVLAMVVLVIQLVTGVWLLMSYQGSAEQAFASVEYIMRDVELGWIIRYAHSTGASAFFIVVYMHMFRGLMYGSYKPPRELVWIFGMTIYVALMAEAFLGYVLPWGQMSYWGAQVIISLFGAIPVVGEDLVQWIRGDYLISGITLNRFMSLHVVAIPIILLALVVMHIIALHDVGSNNPDGVSIKKYKDAKGNPIDGIPFFPYFVIHDLVPIVVFLFVFCSILFFMPEMGGFFLEYANFEIANNLKTPEHIAPVWYFTPFYSMLRAVPDKLGGFIVMAAAIAILFVLPWLDRSPVRSIRYKGMFSRVAILMLAAVFIILGYLGVKAPTAARTVLTQICTVLYFSYFIGIYFWTRIESTKLEPDRISMDGGIGAWKTIGAILAVATMVILPIKAVGSEGKSCGTINCDPFEAQLNNDASLQRGAQLAVNYCMGCHSFKYSRWERVADDLNIPHQMMLDNMVFSGQKIGELMDIAMPSDRAKEWFGATPPDLTLVARSRSSEWVYTYLRHFYADPSRPLGVNNKVYKDVGMPHALLDLQGLPECVRGSSLATNGGVKRDLLTGEDVLDNPCGGYEINKAGSLSPEEYDAAIFDLVNFLTYIAEPMAEQRKHIGKMVLLFLLLLMVPVILLNREYWKGIH